MIEAARMLLAGVVDEGIAAAPSVGAKYGSLRGLGSSLKEALAHALSRPDCLAPICSSLEIHAIENPYVLLTVSTADGAKTTVFGDMPEVENVDRVVTVSGAALFAISQELAGMPPGEVDDLLRRM
ncbi:hypothetical protein [Bradyrhizobium genosp. P]|uniref:hypothetical protein n=1 Tax=Bradyrhizobium genosp. P TaxID=83641 RepID=UPI003CEA89E6